MNDLEKCLRYASGDIRGKGGCRNSEVFGTQGTAVAWNVS